jgi:hypothetical protein
MRLEVLAAVTRVLQRWGSDDDGDQSHFDDRFVALANLQLLMRDRRPGRGAAPIEHRLAEICHAVQNHLTEAWFQPLISAKLNSPDPPEAP